MQVVTLLITAYTISQGQCPRDAYVQYYGKQNAGEQCTTSSDCKNNLVPKTITQYGCINNICSVIQNDGDSCSLSSDCRSNICFGQKCQSSSSLSEGSQCSSDGNCEGNLYCNYATRVCSQRALVGEICFHADTNITTPCFNGSTCPITTRDKTDVYCLIGTSGFTGEYCNPAQRHCASSHFCSTDRQPNSCQPLRADGAKCNFHFECSSGSGCEGTCRKYYSTAAGLAANSSKFCNFGLITLDNICTPPPSLNLPCGSDVPCRQSVNNKLLVCSCGNNNNEGTCQLIIPSSCHSEARDYFGYESQKNLIDEKDIKWLSYLCCLKKHLRKTDAAYWLSDLGSFMTESLDCGGGSSIPDWLIFVIVISVVLLLLIGAYITWRLCKRRKKRLHAEQLADKEVASDLQIGTDTQPTIPVTDMSISTRVKSVKMIETPPKDDNLTKEMKHLSDLQSHPLSRKVDLHEVSAFRNMCPKFSQCPAADSHPHCDIFMHECPQKDKCLLKLDSNHCINFWHVIQNREVCPNHVSVCPDIADPVHQQHFEHPTGSVKSVV